MLAAVLNICTQEELNEATDIPSRIATVVDREKAERRKVIKNKILAIGRLSHMFSLLRCVCLPWLFATYPGSFNRRFH
jgi:serine/threonine-protein phosphatase 2B catalytic subunit